MPSMTPYFDYAATTPLDPRVEEAMRRASTLAGAFANPSSEHPAGRLAAAAVEHAGEQVQRCLNALDYQLTWTSGATESNNLAILGYGMAQVRRRTARRRLLVTATEHAAVLSAAEAAEGLGFAVERLPVEADGRLAPATLKAALGDDVALVSIGHVNNETGVIQPLAALAPLIKASGARFHIDAAQGAGRLPLDAAALGADLISLSAHKFYGPKGVGALVHHPAVRLAPLLHGGGQQQGLRPGTLPVSLIVGQGEALALADDEVERARQYALREALQNRLTALTGVVMNGVADGSPHVLNVAFAGVHGDALRSRLADLNVSFGSACSGQAGASHVLRAMAMPDALADAAVRFSIGRFTTMADVEFIAERVASDVGALRAISPVWREMRAGRKLSDVYGVTTLPNLA